MKALEDLEAAYAAATPDKWSIEVEDGRTFITGEGRQLAKILCTHANNDEYSAHLVRAKANARLIALMHNNLPALIEVARWADATREWAQVCFPEYADVECVNELSAALAKLEETK